MSEVTLDPAERVRIAKHARYIVRTYYGEPKKIAQGIDMLNVRQCAEYRKAIRTVFAEEYRAFEQQDDIERKKVEVDDHIDSMKTLTGDQ